MELYREETAALVPQALVGAVVHVDEEGLPVSAESIPVHRIAVVLGGDVATVSAYEAHGLVVAAVAVFELEGRCASGLGQQLVAHADAENGLLGGHGGLNVTDGLAAVLGVAGAVGDEQAVVVHGIEIIVPGYADDLDVAGAEEAAEDVVLDSAVEQHYFLPLRVAVTDHLLAADYGHLVFRARVVKCLRYLETFGHDAAGHGALFTENLGDLPRIHSEDAGDAVLLEPFVQALDRAPVAVLEGVVGDDQAPDVNPVGLEVDGNTVGRLLFRNSVVAYKRVGYT